MSGCRSTRSLQSSARYRIPSNQEETQYLSMLAYTHGRAFNKVEGRISGRKNCFPCLLWPCSPEHHYQGRVSFETDSFSLHSNALEPRTFGIVIDLASWANACAATSSKSRNLVRLSSPRSNGEICNIASWTPVAVRLSKTRTKENSSRLDLHSRYYESSLSGLLWRWPMR